MPPGREDAVAGSLRRAGAQALAVMVRSVKSRTAVTMVWVRKRLGERAARG